MRSRIRRKVAPLLIVTALAAVVGLVGAGTASAAGAVAGSAGRQTRLRPNIGAAMGIQPVGSQDDVAIGQNYPEVYHGGQVMNTGTVTVHTIFWAPSGYQFDGSPSSGVPGYEALIQQFFTDVAHDSGSKTNVFSMLDQYGDSSAPGVYSIAYNPATDSINDTDPYPASGSQCPSPDGIATCLTDVDVTDEVDHVIATQDPSGFGLHDVWEVYLPADVDECSGIDVCGTTEFAGYHSFANDGQGPFVYAVIIDTLIEGPATAGADPEGNPEAEASIDTAAHETMEASTNPEGVGWMDPNGFEIADKCEDGPQVGTPLGYAPDGSPYDQMINGHEYEIQEIWSNATMGCEQSSTTTTNALPLPSVSLRQFSPYISGNIGKAAAGVPVQMSLVRAGSFVADATAFTRASGAWGPVALKGPHGAPHGLGDDRDTLLVVYGRGGPASDLIATGSGGDPFTEAGWTGWLDLDTGFSLTDHSISVSPCGQTGVLTLTINGRPATQVLPECQTETDTATVSTPPLTDASRIVFTSEDNRAPSQFAPAGAEVSMSVALGEPGSVGSVVNYDVPFESSGIPACTAELRLEVVSCDGLVPGARYTVTRRRGHAARHAKANDNGAITVHGFPGARPIAGGDLLALTNAAHRVLTVLHVAHLRVAIDGNATVIASGRCQPGDYFGVPLTSLPASEAVGEPGATGLGTVCPANGRAHGLSAAVIAETDDLSGGLTRTSLPALEGTAPANDAIVDGAFRALAQTGITSSDGIVYATGARVSASFTLAGAHTPAFRAANVAGRTGVAVSGLADGVYTAQWVVTDANGDTRTVTTTFVQTG